MDSLFGTNESKSTMETGWDGKTLRISYTKYPTLPPMLLNLLQSGEKAMELGTLTQSSAAESVFPALDIIRRAGPPESHRDELYKYIARYLGSHQWHVREIAARTLCSFMLNADWLSSIRKLQEESCVSANRLHGTLLTIKFFLERLFEIKNDHLDGEFTLRTCDCGLFSTNTTIQMISEVWRLSWANSGKRLRPPALRLGLPTLRFRIWLTWSSHCNIWVSPSTIKCSAGKESQLGPISSQRLS